MFQVEVFLLILYLLATVFQRFIRFTSLSQELRKPFVLLGRRQSSRSIMGNLALHSAEEPDNQRAITGTVEVPVTRDNDAALALGARPNQQHEPAARHSSSRNEYCVGGIMTLLLQNHRTVSTKTVCSNQYMVTDQHCRISE